jgi:ribonuclease Z
MEREVTSFAPHIDGEPGGVHHNAVNRRLASFMGGCTVKSATCLIGVVVWSCALVFAPPTIAADRQEEARNMQVVLLGTGNGPTPNAQRMGSSTLVVVGGLKLLFDCGRGASLRLAQAGFALSDIVTVFLTHLHSDHVMGLPDLFLTGWFVPCCRAAPLQVFGPTGTRSMMDHIAKAFAFDVHSRRDVDERFPAIGASVKATDIRQGAVYHVKGVKVTAFLVDHGPVAPAYGYRIDYKGRAVVISGDTQPTDNLVRFSNGVDVLVHEVAGRLKNDPLFSGPPDELIPGGRITRAQARNITSHHTDGVEAGEVFAKTNPRLAVFSHVGSDQILPLVRRHYEGWAEVGQDLMTIDVGEEITVRRPTSVP